MFAVGDALFWLYLLIPPSTSSHMRSRLAFLSSYAYNESCDDHLEGVFVCVSMTWYDDDGLA